MVLWCYGVIPKMSWYCLHLKGNQEFRAEENLLEQNYDVYLPKILDCKLHKKPKVKPLFPEYMFINLIVGEHDFKAVKNTRGIRAFAPKSLTDPIPIDDKIIVELKSWENSQGFHEISESQFYVGEDVVITKGPFDMRQAIVERVEGERIWIIFEIASKNISMEINKLHIEPL